MEFYNISYIGCSMDQEGASYFTTDSTFSVPIILSSESLDTFANSTIPTDNEPMKDDSNEVPQVLPSDISQEQAANTLESVDLSISSETPSMELDTSNNQTQNLKVCTLVDLYDS